MRRLRFHRNLYLSPVSCSSMRRLRFHRKLLPSTFYLLPISPAYLAEPPFYAAAAVPPQFISVPCILFLYAAAAVPPQFISVPCILFIYAAVAVPPQTSTFYLLPAYLAEPPFYAAVAVPPQTSTFYLLPISPLSPAQSYIGPLPQIRHSAGSAHPSTPPHFQ